VEVLAGLHRGLVTHAVPRQKPVVRQREVERIVDGRHTPPTFLVECVACDSVRWSVRQCRICRLLPKMS